MAEEQSKGIQQIEGCEVIYDMGSGLVIAKVPLDKVKEQDINARIMKNEMQDQLTANIKKRGQLESLPLFVLVDGKLEIISGHHRVKSARAAEMKEIIAIVDVSGLSRSKIAAKQLAHNAISGFDDDSTLREIVKMIDDVDDMIESFVGKEIMEEPLEQYDKMLSPAVQFDFKNVTFTFLPHQVKDMDALVKDLESKAPDIVGVASYEQCKNAAIEIWNNEDGPIARITVCIAGSGLAEDETVIDTNNCPWAMEFIKQHGFGQATGRMVKSGYCTYPVVKLDIEKIGEYLEVA